MATPLLFPCENSSLYCKTRNGIGTISMWWNFTAQSICKEEHNKGLVTAQKRKGKKTFIRSTINFQCVHLSRHERNCYNAELNTIGRINITSRFMASFSSDRSRWPSVYTLDFRLPQSQISTAVEIGGSWLPRNCKMIGEESITIMLLHHWWKVLAEL